MLTGTSRSSGNGTGDEVELGLNSRRAGGRGRHLVKVKRPKYMELSKSVGRSIRNDFHEVAHLFFFPVLRVLTHPANREVSEMEQPEKMGQGGSAAARWEGVEDLTDGFQAMLPALALEALATFVRCSVNSHLHR